MLDPGIGNYILNTTWPCHGLLAGIFIWKITTNGPDYNFAQARFTGRNILLLCSNLWNPNITQKVLRNPTGSNFYFISTLEISNIFPKNVLFSLNKIVVTGYFWPSPDQDRRKGQSFEHHLLELKI